MVELSHDNQDFIDDVVVSGRFSNPSAAINEAVQLLRNEIENHGQESVDEIAAPEWCERFERWAESHRHLAHEADDSRESIYAGRGE